MPRFFQPTPPQKTTLYTLRLERFRFAYEISGRKIEITSSINPTSEMIEFMNDMIRRINEKIFCHNYCLSCEEKALTETGITNVILINAEGATLIDHIHMEIMQLFSQHFKFLLRKLGELENPRRSIVTHDHSETRVK